VNFTRMLTSFDARRNALLDELAALPEPALTAHPRSDKWSILEIVEHVIRAERFIFDGITLPDQLIAHRRTFASRVRSVVVHAVLRLDIAVQAPSRKMLPTGTRALVELRAHWDQNSALLSEYAAHVIARRADPAVFSHPVIGPMTFAQSLRLRRAHLDRHVRQIRYLQRLQG
jgi:uncharacterized damage-inducible protein DinB